MGYSRYGARRPLRTGLGDVSSSIASSVPGWSQVQQFFASSYQAWLNAPATLTDYMHRAAQAKATATANGDTANAAAAAALLATLSSLYTGVGALQDKLTNLMSYIPGLGDDSTGTDGSTATVAPAMDDSVAVDDSGYLDASSDDASGFDDGSTF